MRTLFYILSILLAVNGYSQTYCISKQCLLNDEIEIDTCIKACDTLYVICFKEYKIHAKCRKINSNVAEIKVITLLKRTEWPTIGYKHIMDTGSISAVVLNIQQKYSDNETRITKRHFTGRNTKKKVLTIK